MSQYVTVDQAATLLHVSPTTVRRWIYRGNLPALKLKTGKNGRVLINLSDLARLVGPIPQSRPLAEERKQLVERILNFRQRVAGRNVDVDELIAENRRERDREAPGD